MKTDFIRDSSADFERRERRMPISKTRLEENVDMDLWKLGRRHFKPTQKTINELDQEGTLFQEQEK